MTLPKKEDKSAGLNRLTAALVALARHNIPTDVQELLVQGDPMRSIAPGALERALLAALQSGSVQDNEGEVE